ncbi:exosortase F-associated protein [Ohtaekwangia koreensis]|uniref:Exosortase F-associated protein n=2 Tax=Ohtaekwangia koreensis TaxID=688867 RepID=A0A1T5M471_9BACT|nr:exosortase F-associated protein [Ohtaekwangia koreensis]
MDLVGEDFTHHDISKKMRLRIVIGILSAIGLALVFLFQRINVAEIFNLTNSSIHQFIINRTIRFLLNDLLTIGLIYALFYERKYLIFSFWVQGIGIIFFLIPYFVMKIYYPDYNGPLLSFLHRLILNPTLLLLLIPAFYYQKKINTKDTFN